MSAQGKAKRAIYYKLKNTSAVTAIATGGIHQTQIKQKSVPPFVLITEEGISPQDTKTDAVGTGATTNLHYLTVSCYARTELLLNNLAAAVDAALNHLSGTIDTIVVDDCRFVNSNTDAVEDIHYTDMDFEVWTNQ